MSDGRRELDSGFDHLEAELPERVARAIRWLRDPRSRRVRLPAGVLLLGGGVLWFLPVLGAWMLPLGLLLIAQDVPFLRRPVGRGTVWLAVRWRALKERWRGAPRAGARREPGRRRP